MKKILFVLTTLLLLSCSSSSDDNNTSNSDFHPPNWIQGNWTQEGIAPNSGVLFSFSSNDLCMTVTGITKICQQESVNSIRKSGGNTTVKESITSTTYTAEITTSGISTIYTFRKLSNTTIEWTAVSGSVFIKQ